MSGQAGGASANFIIHYLILLSVSDRLGLPVAPEKLEGLWCQLMFLGFELDSSALVIHVPP